MNQQLIRDFEKEIKDDISMVAMDGSKANIAYQYLTIKLKVLLEQLILQANKQDAETQQSIGQWADEAFGKATDLTGTAIRANKEMAELLDACINGKPLEEIGLEGADVVIVIARMFESFGLNLNDCIAEKMKINRSRTWVLDGKGHGQHIPNLDKE